MIHTHNWEYPLRCLFDCLPQKSILFNDFHCLLNKDCIARTIAIANHQDQLKAAHIEQEKKKKRESAAREANKMKLQEHENKVRGALLDAFTKEDQERLQKNARKRLGGKE